MHHYLSVRIQYLFEIKRIFFASLFLVIVISPSFPHFFSSPVLRLLLLYILPSTPTPRFTSYSPPLFVVLVLVLVISLAPPVFLYFVFRFSSSPLILVFYLILLGFLHYHFLLLYLFTLKFVYSFLYS